MAVHDPLHIVLSRQLAALGPSLPQHALDGLSTTKHVLCRLSTLLALPAHTYSIATLFRPILLDLCARWLETAEDAQGRFAALCFLVEVHEELFPILNQFILNVFPNGPLASLISSSPTYGKDLQKVLLAYYRVLNINGELPTFLNWPVHHLSSIIWDRSIDNGSRLLAIQCYAKQTGMGEEERLKIEAEVFGESYGVDCPIVYGQALDGSEELVDGWLLPTIEYNRVQDFRNDIVNKPQDYYTPLDGPNPFVVRREDLSPLVVNICGVLMLRSSPIPPLDSPFVAVPTSTSALQQLATHISIRVPTLLTSQPSGGKALLLSHAAQTIYPDQRNQLVSIHLADTSLDARGLLGCYVSSTTRPGCFDWKEGVLVRAMREGKWVVLEDIDRGSNEVLGVLKPLAESLALGKWIGGRARITVPGHGQVIAHERFLLFATRSTKPTPNGAFQPPSFLGSHKFHEISFAPFGLDEVETIVATKFPRLARSYVRALVEIWDSVRQVPVPGSNPSIGLRELERFCGRIQDLFGASYSQTQDAEMDVDSGPQSFSRLFPNPSIREDIYIHARDVFVGAGIFNSSTRAYNQTVLSILGDALGFDAERQEWILNSKCPEFEVEKDTNGVTTSVRSGRTRIAATTVPRNEALPSSRPFVIHKPAKLLLSRIAVAVAQNEPLLLTGETGTGKTSIISHLASLLHKPLLSFNLSQQTESSDLIGGLKPVDARIPAAEIQERFIALFEASFSRKRNEKFEKDVWKAVNGCKWKRAAGLWKESARLAMDKLKAKGDGETRDSNANGNGTAPEPSRKRRKIGHSTEASYAAWSSFVQKVEEFEIQHVHGSGKFAFGFVEGPLIKALRAGHWILLDEINLASPETLECISTLLQTPESSITLTEQGSLEPVPRHPEFRLFACMNPATDLGKKDLPPNIRSRFTEIDVLPPDADKETLLSIISQYVGHFGDKRLVMDVAELYGAVKALSESGEIADGVNHRPHFSMRTLTRALTFAADTAPMFGLRRAVWEGCFMAFTMVLDGESAEKVTALAQKHLLSQVSNPKSWLKRDMQAPSGNSEAYFKQGPFYLEKGSFEREPDESYILTPSVYDKLTNLARIILNGRSPVLIEGPTSSGKTSAVEYLAKMTHHKFVRINNHDHTDIQEYLGSYVSDPLTGKLVFKDGLLVQALRNGYWIVLDELNLAPSDVLEALNRLLDDNREILIPETQEIVRPHPHFRLFATQNPPGLYAGRKILSRAFRNRFLEVHFQDVPPSELETILCQRCQIAPSYGKKIVNVFHELQKRRQIGRVFESKQGFATLRDLFRWAGRDAVGYDELARNGYMLLAERARRAEDKAVVKEVLEKELGVRIDEEAMYDLESREVDVAQLLGCPVPRTAGVVWTKAMQRLYVLVARALKYNEPVLLVGETGSGKTSVCQIYADACSQQLLALNCHQNTETADLIGGLRPLRNRAALHATSLQEATAVLQEAGVEHPALDAENAVVTLKTILSQNVIQQDRLRSRLEDIHERMRRQHSIFQWHDGPLVEAMHNGDVFLLDEISLADDSVLERLNSVLEPSRSLTLAERGGDDSESSFVTAVDRFKLLATMNPGGDYGKKELSPALRNRFTEIWVPPVDDRSDLQLIIDQSWNHEVLKPFTSRVLDFVDWICQRVDDTSLAGLRDILAWVRFMNATYNPVMMTPEAIPDLFHHGAHMTYLDGLGSLPQLAGFSKESITEMKRAAINKLEELAPVTASAFVDSRVEEPGTFTLGPFSIPRGSLPTPIVQPFNFEAQTSLSNAVRVLRACQVTKPILLEGSPGVGKTSLITALAQVSGHRLCRINLSDQTDLMDLFGSDLPVEGGRMGEFTWKDAEFLNAVQEGHWVLLDEMNLAPQAVLEGLNAILDHRGTVYIPELNRSFTRHPSFRIFAAQNPLGQGGGRKGLPRSFVNRFTKVYVEELNEGDLMAICGSAFPGIDGASLRAMITFNSQLNRAASIERSFAREGSPWEFNLRDLMRWGKLMTTPGNPQSPLAYLRSVYLNRFRTNQDRDIARRLYEKAFSSTVTELDMPLAWTVSPGQVVFGHFRSTRNNLVPTTRPPRILKNQLSALEALGDCVAHSWLAILTGVRESGKTEVVRTLAAVMGHTLHEISVNSTTDAMDFLGSFEQVDQQRQFSDFLVDLDIAASDALRSSSGSKQLAPLQDQFRKIQSLVPSHPLHELQDQVYHLLDQLPAPHHSAIYPLFSSRLQEIFRTASTISRFEWVDGPLVKAIKAGQWLLIDGANLCNPSVLDRLNSLCESNGKLALSERGFVNGQVEVLEPHRDFRLFMTVDPHYGELSRAMRNRGIEITLVNDIPSDDDRGILAHFRLPSASPLFPAAFDSARRGIVSQPSSPPTPSTPPPLMSLHDTAQACLEGLQSIFPTSATGDANNLGQAHALVAGRMLVPSHIPIIKRKFNQLLAEPTLFGKFLAWFIDRSFFSSNLSCSRERQEVASHLNAHSLLEYPTYFYHLVPHPGKLEGQPLRQALLDFLDIGVTSFFHENLRSSFNESLSGGRTAHEGRALSAVSSVLDEISDAISTMTTRWTGGYEAEFSILSSAVRIVDFLCKSMQAGYFDFSVALSTVQPLASLLEGGMNLLPGLRRSVNNLLSMVSLSTGLGLTQLWDALSSKAPLLATQGVQELDIKATSVKPELIRSVVRRQTFDLMAIETSPARISQDARNTISALRDELNKCHTYCDADSTTKQGTDGVDPRSLLLELLLLSSASTSSLEAFSEVFSHIVAMSCDETRAPLLRLVPYEHLRWAKDGGSDYRPQLFMAQLAWLEGLWRSRPIQNITGPGVLFQPAQLYALSDACAYKANPLRDSMTYHDRVQRLAKYTLIQVRNRTTESAHLEDVFIHVLEAIIAPFISPSVPEQDLRRGDLPTRVSRALSKLQDPSIISLAQQSLGLIERVETGGIQALGVAWLGIGKFLFDLVVPDHPVDPAAIQQSYRERLERDGCMLHEQIDQHRRLEDLWTGGRDNDMVQSLTQTLVDVERGTPPPGSLPSRALPRVHAYWLEAWRLRDNLFASRKIDDLVEAAQGGGDVSAREMNVQESLAGFCLRIDSTYPEFADINSLVKMALLCTRFGLRLATQPNINSPLQQAAELTAFPSIHSAQTIISQFEASHTSDIPIHHVILTLQASLFLHSTHTIAQDHPVTYEAFEKAMSLWSIDRAKEERKEQESSTLYRGAMMDHQARSDEEIEQQEFLELFPTYGEDEEMPKTPHLSDSHVREEDAATVARLHLALHESPLPDNSSSLLSFSSTRRSAIQSRLTSSTSTALGAGSTLPVEVLFLQHAQSRLQATTSDFYHDSNIPEAKKASTVLIKLANRLRSIIREWPDQMVLHHLLERTESILDLPLDSPIAKVLNALEQLLLQTEDWEMYANRDNNLKAERADLIDLIIAWRRFELSCWQQLLNSESRTFEQGASAWWFRLYDCLVRGAAAAAEDEDEARVAEYLAQLVPLLDDFIFTSPAGQFNIRMRLLKGFQEHLSRVKGSAPPPTQTMFTRVERIVHSTHARHALYALGVEKHLADQQSTLEKNIQDFIKLASWKDINVQALKQSAQKTHHQLFKIVRKFREVLRQPVKQLCQLPRDDLPSSSACFQPFPPLPSQLPNVLSSRTQLQSKYSKFASFLIHDIVPATHASNPALLDELAVTIITTSRDLASVSIPNLSGEAKTKYLKTIQVRKRKAWSDLLKELKRFGLPHGRKAEVLRRNESEVWVREQPIIRRGPPSDAILLKTEAYFTKICSVFPDLRVLLHNHHSDMRSHDLERARNMVEFGFSLAIDLRTRFSEAAQSAMRLNESRDRLRLFLSADTFVSGSNLVDHVRSARDNLSKLWESILELRHHATVLNGFQGSVAGEASFWEESRVFLDSGKVVIDRLDSLLTGLASTPFKALLQSEYRAVQDAISTFSNGKTSLATWQVRNPTLSHWIDPIQSWLERSSVVDLAFPRSRPVTDTAVEAFVNTLLLSIQSLVQQSPNAAGSPTEETDQCIALGYEHIRKFTHLLNLRSVESTLETILFDLPSSPHHRDTLDTILPFLDPFLSLVDHQLTAHKNWMKGLFKLDYVLCNLLRSLCEQGFCKPPEEEESGDSGAGEAELAEGTGIGDGSGKENISEDIEDESQVEGLKGEQDQNQDSKDADDGKAIEMGDDFEGEMEDVPDSGDEEGAPSDDEGEEEDIDETMGQLDSLDPSKLDKKLWGDEKGPDSKDNDDKTKDDHSKQEGEGESEMVAKEDNNTQNPSQKQDEAQTSEESQPDADVVEDEEGMDEDTEQPEEVQDDQNKGGAQMDDQVQDANTLDLPDDLNLDDDVNGGDDSMDQDQDLSDGDDTVMADEEEGPSRDDPPQDDDMQDSLDSPDDFNDPHQDPQNQETTNEDESNDPSIAREDVSSGGGQDHALQPNNTRTAEDQAPSEGTGARGKGDSQNESGAELDQAEDQQEAQHDDSLPQREDSASAGATGSGRQEGQSSAQSQEALAPNPLRSIGDSLKEIQRRFEEILQSSSEVVKDRHDDPEATQMEYLKPEDADHDMEALGTAGDEQAAKLERLKLVDGAPEDEAPIPMDIDDPLPVDPEVKQDLDAPSSNIDGTAGQIQDVAGAIRHTERPPMGDTLSQSGGIKGEPEISSEMVELQLKEWKVADYPDGGSSQLWRSYEALTHDLSYSLCEQLRLILEPTLATRLKGDYRTGKRLNMKKIIPYIASDFAKDKIWLRRTKPSQREYQVLIAIDDSRSMAESHSIHLAYQTLALISKALSRLESGDIAIAKFGEAVELLHSFDSGPFTDQAGTKIIDAFRFNQKATDVLSLLQTSLKVLEAGRERRSASSATAADLWQLQFIVSDGMCQDHEKLRVMLRKAEEQRVMVVFIILDSLHRSTASPSSSSDHASILSMQRAEVTYVNGKPDLQLRKYLDTFPFEYYVVLRNVEALPDVLSETLKQFFERISEE